jgi:hypothetical protein
MPTFKKMKEQMQKNFLEVINGQDVLYVTDVEKDVIWNTYLNAFPPEEMQFHNCNSCRQFLKPFANVVAIENNKLVSIWDFECEAPFDQVVKSLNDLVTSAPIKNVFVSKLKKLGTDFNHEEKEDGNLIRWEHFHLMLPDRLVTRDSKSEEAIMGGFRDHKDVFKRGLEEFTVETVETVLDLIAQNSLYRGAEFKGMLEAFLVYEKLYVKLPNDQKDNFVWANSVKASGAVSKLRNTSIGTLLIDIAKGIDLDQAVTSFERNIMAPANYKRPQAIVSKKMIEDAQKTIEEMGLLDSLGRRYAIADDITVNNVLFVNRGAKTKATSSVFEDLAQDVVINPKKLTKVEEVSIDDFINKIVPKATGIELLMENKLTGNLVSIIAPKDAEAPSLFKWNNGFSWSYVNNVTDSIKENVKQAGGNVDGVLRFSIQWNDKGDNNIDFDAHATEPDRTHIYYSSSYRKDKMNGMTRMTGQLDVDIINPYGKIAVENITWINRSKMGEGVYKFWVHNYSSSTSRGGFTAEIEFDGERFSFDYPSNLKGGQDVYVADVKYSKAEGFRIVKSLESNTILSSKEVWGVNTNKFQKVNMLMVSPNHWDGQSIGNKHYFFVLDKCKNAETSRGFYNEFLKDELMQQKRVFEALGNKLVVEPSDEQLSGVGFSTTNRAQFLCKVDGTFSRIIKVTV